MKRIYLFVVAMLILMTAIIACTKEGNPILNIEEESLELMVGKAMSYEEFFENISEMDIQLEEENLIFINYQWNAKEETFTLLGFEEKEPDFFVLDFILDLETKGNTEMTDPYQVVCDLGEDSWDEYCSGKFSCGKLIAKCLDAGGCATMCNNTMAYNPESKTFYLLANDQE